MSYDCVDFDLELSQVVFPEGLEAEIVYTEPHAQIFSQRTLTDLERMMQRMLEFELYFLLETSHFLK